MSERQQLPTREDLKKLSLRGIVAYAARAARRVRPLFHLDETGEISQKHDDAVDDPNISAERSAENARAANAAESSTAAAAYAAQALLAVNDPADDTTQADAASEAAFYAAVHAVAATDDDAYDDNDSRNVLCDALWRDYDRLLRLTTARAPALGDPIDLNQLGPLWPNGAPDWFADSPQATVTKSHGAPSIFVAWNPELISADDYARLVEMLGDLARAEGGAGITRLRSHGFGVPIGAGVPQ